MNLCLTSPVRLNELYINLACFFLFTRKIEIIYGSKFILLTYIINLSVTALSFLPCNVRNKINFDKINQNSLNLVISHIIFMKFRLAYLHSLYLDLAFYSLLIYLLRNLDYEFRNIYLSGLLSSIFI